MARFGQTMLDAVARAGRLEAVGAERLAARDGFLDERSCRGDVAGRGEVGAVVGENRVHPAGHGGDQVAQEVTGYAARGSLVQRDEGELGRAIDGHEQVQPALRRVHLGDVDSAMSIWKEPGG